jgi:hypothetical protein
MSNILAVHYARVKNGRLLLTDKSRFDHDVQAHEGREVVLTIRRSDDIRTNAENRYYWGVIVKIVADEMGIIPDEAHDFLKHLFLKQGVEVDGKRFEIARSTADLTIAEFESYCERCRQWAAAELGAVIPLPGEVILDW